MILHRFRPGLLMMAGLAAAALTSAASGQTVYFHDDLSNPDVVLMRGVSPDGKKLQTLPHGVLGEPSHAVFTESTPGGPFSYRWFLAKAVVGDGLSYPEGGVQHMEIYATRPTATGGVIRVPLTALWSPNSETDTVRFTPSADGDEPRWSGGQSPSFFSFSGYRRTAAGAFVDQEYYRVDLDLPAFDAAVRDGSWSPVTVAGLATIMARRQALNPNNASYVLFNGHHWSPDGTKMVRIQDRNYVIVRDVAAGTEQIVYTSNNLQVTVSWSPTGAKIAFGEYSAGGRIVSMNPDGTAPSVLIRGSQQGFRSLNYTGPVWSPDALSLACVRENLDSGKGTISTDVVRIPAGGTTKPVSISAAVPSDGTRKTLQGWRP
jgi:hypothetical protein